MVLSGFGYSSLHRTLQEWYLSEGRQGIVSGE